MKAKPVVHVLPEIESVRLKKTSRTTRIFEAMAIRSRLGKTIEVRFNFDPVEVGWWWTMSGCVVSNAGNLRGSQMAKDRITATQLKTQNGRAFGKFLRFVSGQLDAMSPTAFRIWCNPGEKVYVRFAFPYRLAVRTKTQTESQKVGTCSELAIVGAIVRRKVPQEDMLFEGETEVGIKNFSSDPPFSAHKKRVSPLFYRAFVRIEKI